MHFLVAEGPRGWRAERVTRAPGRAWWYPDPVLVGSMAFGLVVYGLLPHGVSAVSDDFSYYRSVVATLQHHRPWTDEFLEPWSAGLSTISAVVYALTGSFAVATHGVQVALAVVGCWAGGRLLVARGVAPRRAVLLAGLVLSFPIALIKAVEYNSMALYVPCLLLALLAAERGRWGWFAVPWVLALATRQTALVWGILPAVAAWRARAASRRGAAGGADWRVPAAVAVAGLLAFGGLALGMNVTHAQLSVTKPQLLGFVGKLGHGRALAWIAAKLAIGASVFGLAAALGGWAHGLTTWRPGRATAIKAAVGCALVAGWVLLGARWMPKFHGFEGPLALGYLAVVGGIALAVWIAGTRPALTGPMVATAAAGLAGIAVHDFLMPYYLLETALFGFFAVKVSGSETGGRSASRGVGARGRWWGRAAVAALAAGQVFWIANVKLSQDVLWAEVQTVEPALRDGRIRPGEVACPPGPIGWNNWHVVPYLYAHEGQAGGGGAGFVPRLSDRHGAVKVVVHLPSVLRYWPGAGADATDAGGEEIGRSVFRCLGFFRGEVVLRRASPRNGAPATGRVSDPADYHPERFPLDDAEWRGLIRAGE